MLSALLRRRTLGVATAALVAMVGASTSPATAQGPAAERHVQAYYQTQYVANDGGQSYVSPLPLRGIATDVHVGALHLMDGGEANLNDDPPSAPKFQRMWDELADLRSSGTRVNLMLGGAGTGSYAELHENFDQAYGTLVDVLRTYRFDGVDLDIEEKFSLSDTKRLISALREDFGPDFAISLTPVATDLSGESNFSGGFSYKQLEAEAGDQIDWYTGQFYCGWGDLSSGDGYERILDNGIPASKVVTAALTNPDNCDGFVGLPALRNTVGSLADAHPDFGGIAGWEYFNAQGGDGGPETWFDALKTAMG